MGVKPHHQNSSDINLEETSIKIKSGFFNNLTNQRELEVTISFKDGQKQIVKMDAYSGKCLGITGLLS